MIKDDKFSSLYWQFCIQSIEKVPGFWKIHAYKIGGQVFNLDEIEHGVLRSNRGKNWYFIKFFENNYLSWPGHPSAGKPEFSDSDPRHKMALTSLDPRIHFALNCGASSCPPIRIYTEDRLLKCSKCTKCFIIWS